MRMSIDLKIGSFLTHLQKVDDKFKKRAMRAAEQCANESLKRSKIYCPKKTLALVRSGRVEQRGRWGREFWVIYGNKTAYYAAYVHEILEAYHEPPTRAKFLEVAIRELKNEGRFKQIFQKVFKEA